MLNHISQNTTKGLLLGLAAGDALGVPVKGKTKEEIGKNPVTNFFDSREQPIPAGTWTAGSALSFCLAEAILENASLDTIAENFLLWEKENYWTAIGKKLYADEKVLSAVQKIERGEHPKATGDEHSVSTSGAGALMRISPLVFFLLNKPVHKRFEIVKQVTAITHSDSISIIGCFYYLEFLLELLEGKDKYKIYLDLQEKLPVFLKSVFIKNEEITAFSSLLEGKIYNRKESEMSSSSEIIDCLNASLWSFLNTHNFKEATLKAVNLGNDTNTVGAVTGALAGTCYGSKNIPSPWLHALARKDEIEDLAIRVYFKLRD